VTKALSVKRLVDIIVALSLLALLSPLIAVLAWFVHIKLGNPVFFRQSRAGKDGKIFTLYKFRTMKDLRDKNGTLLSDAERLTPFGKTLRATSLDELPELWNVLTGFMSLIGPRPLLPDYLPYYSETQQKRHVMRPGLTGLAQIKGRNALSWDERLAYDVWYIEHWSLWLDLSIACSTLGVVLSRKGIVAEGSVSMPRFDDYVRATRKNVATSGK